MYDLIHWFAHMYDLIHWFTHMYDLIHWFAHMYDLIHWFAKLPPNQNFLKSRRRSGLSSVTRVADREEPDAS